MDGETDQTPRFSVSTSGSQEKGEGDLDTETDTDTLPEHACPRHHPHHPASEPTRRQGEDAEVPLPWPDKQLYGRADVDALKWGTHQESPSLHPSLDNAPACGAVSLGEFSTEWVRACESATARESLVRRVGLGLP